MLSSGLLLLFGEPMKLFGSPSFHVKMMLLFLAIVFQLTLFRRVSTDRAASAMIDRFVALSRWNPRLKRAHAHCGSVAAVTGVCTIRVTGGLEMPPTVTTTGWGPGGTEAGTVKFTSVVPNRPGARPTKGRKA